MIFQTFGNCLHGVTCEKT